MDARTLTARLPGGHWHGQYGMACCPAHKDSTPSLKIVDDPRKSEGVDVHCFAGCSWQEVKAALKLERNENAPHRRISPHRTETGNRNRDHALEIWRASRPAVGTLVEEYLRGRGITLPPPASIRFHPALRHPIGLEFPALVAAVQAPDRTITGVQRIFLTADGRKKAQISEPKLSLGRISGGAVRLGPAGGCLALAESVEDASAFMQITSGPCWAALGTSGFKSFIPPEGVHTMILAPDNDEAGRAVLRPTAEHLRNRGLTVKALLPGTEKDWCDMLETYEERAGIMQHDGGLPAQDAEDLAFDLVMGATNAG